MRIVRSSTFILVSLFLAACATTLQAPSAEVKQSLAPTGKLRVGLLSGTPAHAMKDPYSGDLKGVAHDVGRALAGRLGVPFEPVLYTSPGPFIEGGRKGEWDVAFLGRSPEREASYDFAANHLEIDYGYLAPGNSSIANAAMVDRPGTRVVVVEKGSPDVFLTGHLKSATLTRVARLSDALEALKSGKADVWGAQKANLFTSATQLPGSRILEGRPGAETQAMVFPKGRSAAALEYARRFVEEAKASGMVKESMERAGLQGASVAAPL